MRAAAARSGTVSRSQTISEESVISRFPAQPTSSSRQSIRNPAEVDLGTVARYRAADPIRRTVMQSERRKERLIVAQPGRRPAERVHNDHGGPRAVSFRFINCRGSPVQKLVSQRSGTLTIEPEALA